MKFRLIMMILFLFNTTLSYAKQCQIDRLTSTQLRLNASYLSQAATSFHVSCDTRYAIQFNSRNLTSSYGSSYVINQKNQKLRTQMNIIGTTSSRWNIPISQPAGINDKFTVLVQLLDKPTPFTAAGLYRDQLYISLMF